MRKAYLIYNPAAGRFPSRLLTERAADVLRSKGWEITLKKSDGGRDTIRLAEEAVILGMDTLFVAGGDGSIRHAVAGLMGSETSLGVLPAGTANVWAQELGLPGLSYTRWMALEESARLLADASVRKVDVGVCNDHPFLLWTGIGLDGFIVHRIEPRSRWEKHFAVAQYAASAVLHTPEWGGMNLRAVADDIEVSGMYLLAVASNIHLYAGGLANLSPSARLDDGKMELWLFEGETLVEVVRHAWNLWAGRHLTSDQAKRISFQRLNLISEAPLYIQIDGEPLKGDGNVSIRIHPLSLQVLVPEQVSPKLFSRPTT